MLELLTCDLCGLFCGGEVPTLTHGWMKKSNIGEVTFN